MSRPSLDRRQDRAETRSYIVIRCLLSQEELFVIKYSLQMMSRALDLLQFLPVTLALGFELLYILTILQPQLFVILTLGVSLTYVFFYIDLWSC